MRLEEHVGGRIKAARESEGITLQALGERMEKYIGRAWTAQAVWQAENGKRDFKVAHLAALALALGAPLSYLLAVPEGERLTLDGSHRLTRRETDQLFRPTGHVTGIGAAMYDALVGIQKARRELVELRRHERAAWQVTGQVEDAVLTLYRVGRSEA